MPKTKKPEPDDVIIDFDPPAVKPALIKSITNVHPADELAEVREQIKVLQGRADKLRDELLSDIYGDKLKGDEYVAVLVPSVRETLDRKAITEAYGEEAIKPYLKTTKFMTVKLEARR